MTTVKRKAKVGVGGGELGITPFDPAAGLDCVEEMAEYLSTCLESGNMAVFLAAVGDVTKAAGMARVSGSTGLTFNSLYKTFAPGRKPRFDTVVKVLNALGVGVAFQALSPSGNGHKALKTPKGTFKKSHFVRNRGGSSGNNVSQMPVLRAFANTCGNETRRRVRTKGHF